MKKLLAPCLVVLFLAPAVAQQPGRPGRPGKPPKPDAPAAPTTETKWRNDAFEVAATFPGGWAKKLDEPKAAGANVDLVRFEEPRTKATATLSYQATQYRTAEQMFEGLRSQFQSDTSLAILRTETRTATASRPQGIFFEYTFQGTGGPQHAVAAYWLHLGRRYRIYATAPESAWRSVGSDVESIVSSLSLTGRAFSDSPQNFRDETANYEIWFPETFRIRLPARGPRVIFQSDRLGVGIWVYVNDDRSDLAGAVERLVRTLKEDGAEVVKQTRPETHPALGVDTVTLEWTKKNGGTTYRYRETVIHHRERLYRFVLAAADRAFASGEEHYSRLVRSISFLR